MAGRADAEGSSDDDTEHNVASQVGGVRPGPCCMPSLRVKWYCAGVRRAHLFRQARWRVAPGFWLPPEASLDAMLVRKGEHSRKDVLIWAQYEQRRREPTVSPDRRADASGSSELYEGAMSHANREAAEECFCKAQAAAEAMDIATVVGRPSACGNPSWPSAANRAGLHVVLRVGRTCCRRIWQGCP